jgi:hypothetical protein
MGALRDALRVSPQQVDPLSWVASPLVGATFTVLAAVYGGINVIAGWERSERPWFDVVAVVLLVGACILITVRSHPLRPAFGFAAAALPLVLAFGSLTLSTLAHLTSSFAVQFWWAPVALGLLLGTLVGASTAAQLMIYGLIVTVPTGVGAAVAFGGVGHSWSTLNTVLIACSMPVAGAISASAFCFSLVYTSQRLQRGAGLPDSDSTAAQQQAAREVELRALARLGSRVAPFLAGIAAAGEVTQEDRALAGQLARRLRSDLVSTANESWLDKIASGGRMFIVDPDHRADSMNAAQRSALRGLLTAVLGEPSTDTRSLFIELRGQADGSTAVAISLDLDLPEGRRITMLAPYYVTLKATVDDLSWDRGRELLRFRVPPGRPW